MATLTDKRTVTVSVGGEEHRFDYEKTHDVTQVIDQSIFVTTTEQTVLTIGANEAGATLADVTYLMIENRDSTNYVEIGFKETGGGESAYFRLKAGDAFTLTNQSFSAADGGSIDTSIDWVTVTAKADTSSCLVRIFACDDATS